MELIAMMILWVFAGLQLIGTAIQIPMVGLPRQPLTKADNYAQLAVSMLLLYAVVLLTVT